jgi:hypothetical protein
MLEFVLRHGFDALALLLPGRDYNTGLWIPQGCSAHNEVIEAVSQGPRWSSGRLARSKEPINPRKDIAGASTDSCAG